MSEIECPDDGTVMVPAVAPYRTRLPDSTPMELPAVAGWRCEKCGAFNALGRELRIETLRQRARALDLYPEEVPILMMLAASTPDASAVGRVRSRTGFHKMLFEAWKRLDYTTLIFGKFNPAPNGPMYDDFDRLENHLSLKKLVTVKPHVPQAEGTEYKASERAIQIGQEFMEIAPPEWQDSISGAKRAIYDLSATDAAKRVHKSDPDWRKKQ